MKTAGYAKERAIRPGHAYGAGRACAVISLFRASGQAEAQAKDQRDENYSKTLHGQNPLIFLFQPILLYRKNLSEVKKFVF